MQASLGSVAGVVADGIEIYRGIRFAKTGSPNLVGQPVWPAYDADEATMVFANEGVAIREACARSSST